MKKTKAESPKDPVRVVEISWHPRCTHRVYFPGAGGKRSMKYFVGETDALAFAKKCRAELGVNGTAFGSVTEDERSALDCWRGFKAVHPEAPDMLVVVRQYAKGWSERNASVTIAEALEKHLKHLEAEGASKRHLAAVRSRVGRLAETHGAKLVAGLDAGSFEDWLNGLRGARADVEGRALSLTTRDNLKRTIRSFYSYCMSRGWVSENPVPRPAKKRTKEHRIAKRSAPAIMSPADIERFLHTVEAVASPILPFWALKFFAGIRDAEAGRLDWSHVSIKRGTITVPAEVSKTGDSRTVKIEPTLARWLSGHAKKSGPLAPADAPRRYYYKKVLRHLRKPEKKGGKPRAFKFPSNAARHSFGTYHLYHFRSPGETALQLGHKGNPAMLWEHYANPAAEDNAAAFWQIAPTKDKVVSMGRRPA